MASDPSKPGSRDYIRPIGLGWWLTRRRYTLYMIREATCVAVGGYTLFLLFLVSRAGDDCANDGGVGHDVRDAIGDQVGARADEQHTDVGRDDRQFGDAIVAQGH